MKDIYYVNASGKKMDLLSDRFKLQTGTLFDHDNEYTVNGLKVVGISGMLTEKELLLTIQEDGYASFEEAMEQFNNCTEPDVINKTPGRLYYGDSYQQCFLKGAELLEWEYDAGYTDKKIKMLTACSSWITEQNFTFLPATGADPESDGLDFPTDLPFDFASSGNKTVHRTVDHYASSHFQMTVYGPCVDPRITINSYPYQVFATLETGEYLVIDSRENTITKYLNNGTTENLYNSRQFSPSVFEKIPSGNLALDWPGTFGFDVTLYLERSEPKWK